jgi:valyl-tRNA synthetase
MKIESKLEIDVDFYSPDADLCARAEQYAQAFSGLARTILNVVSDPPSKEGGTLRHTPLFTLRIPYAGTVDTEAERKRLSKDLEGLVKQQKSLESQLADPAKLERAPKHVVEGMRAKLEENKAQQQKIRESLESLG